MIIIETFTSEGAQTTQPGTIDHYDYHPIFRFVSLQLAVDFGSELSET